MKEQLERLETQALARLAKAVSDSQVEEIRVGFLGRKGSLATILRTLGNLDPEERPAMGQVANRVRDAIQGAVAEAKKRLQQQALEAELAGEPLDTSAPGRRPRIGRLHPVTLVVREITSIFQGLGFRVARGPEVETEGNNFEALNILADHPARDMQDTFYLENGKLLRTHTSPVQIRVMRSQPPPVRIIAPGAVYRCDSDVSHTPQFHQVEGLLVDRGISFGDLKGVLTAFIHRVFHPQVALRFRPSYFPFTEPSAEVDIACVLCQGRGCRTCGHSGWLEIMGAGMVDPAVFANVGYDPEEVSGFAFGMGVERIAMLKHGVGDIRAFFEGDRRFLEQF